jgi:hypothetical protein
VAATARVVAGVLALLTLLAASVAAPRADAEPAALGRGLAVTLTKVGDGTIHPGERVVVRGVVTNPGLRTWLDAQVYLQISNTPATTIKDLRYFASVPDNPGGLGNLLLGDGLFDEIGNVEPGHRVPFKVSVPYDELGISGDPGVYRVGVDVVATPEGGARYLPGFRSSTLMPLLAPVTASYPGMQTVTLLPIAAPVKRLSTGLFANDSLSGLLTPHGRLTNLLDWVLLAPPGTIQVVIDPALLSAITDMARGYQVAAPGGSGPNLDGQGRTEAAAWIQKFATVKSDQHVMYLPWGGPAVASLLAHHLPGPVAASVGASATYRDQHDARSFVAGWLPDEGSSIRAVTVLHDLHIDLQILSQANLPGLAAYSTGDRMVPPQVTISAGGRQIPVLVATNSLAGLPTLPSTSALQVRQRLAADAMVRSLSGSAGSITVTALPFDWNPGAVRPSQGVGAAFDLPVLVAQSAVGALDRTGTAYHGAVRPAPNVFSALPRPVLERIHDLRLSGGSLTAIFNTEVAERTFRRTFAMSGSAQWRAFPLLGAQLIAAQAARDARSLAKVRITGPPFVAMSSNSGRFPLTVTNGLGRPITVGIAVKPADPGLSVAPIAPIRLEAGQQRDVQVVTTADGSGVTSVRARLAVPGPDGGPRFGKAWRFDVRSTQIGLVIWIVMAVGGAVLFGAASYRIVQRIRGNGPPRRQVATG